MKNEHAQALGKLGGQVKSAAKAMAAQRNGKLGGPSTWKKTRRKKKKEMGIDKPSA